MEKLKHSLIKHTICFSVTAPNKTNGRNGYLNRSLCSMLQAVNWMERVTLKNENLIWRRECGERMCVDIHHFHFLRVLLAFPLCFLFSSANSGSANHYFSRGNKWCRMCSYKVRVLYVCQVERSVGTVTDDMFFFVRAAFILTRGKNRNAHRISEIEPAETNNNGSSRQQRRFITCAYSVQSETRPTSHYYPNDGSDEMKPNFLLNQQSHSSYFIYLTGRKSVDNRQESSPIHFIYLLCCPPLSLY